MEPLKQLPNKSSVAEVPVTISEELPVVSIHCKPVPNYCKPSPNYCKPSPNYCKPSPNYCKPSPKVLLTKIHDQKSLGVYKRITQEDIDIEE